MTRPPIDRRSFCLGAMALLAASADADADEARPGVGLGVGASLGGARPFPNTDPWNRDISRSPVDPRSAALLRSIGLEKPLRPDFGSAYNGKSFGIPYVVVPGTQPRVRVRFDNVEESDPGPYPVPPDAPIEGGPGAADDSDRHVLILDRDAWVLYELFAARREADGWHAGSGAIFDLKSNTARPRGWTSADAAGLPIFPGLVRHDEAAEAGSIRHALRFTCRQIRRAYVPPASHYVNRLTSPDLPPMGMRVRLRQDFETKPFPKPARAVLEALKTYGMILADAGSDWFISGAPDGRWVDDELATLKRVRGKDLEVVAMGPMTTGKA